MVFSEQFSDRASHDQQLIHDCLHHLFEVQADKSLLAPAIDDRCATLTYEQVEAKSNHLAHYLRHQGVICNHCVGLLIPRSPELYIAILAILKAGGAYVPLDPEYPADRIDYILSDCGIATILTTEDLAQEKAIGITNIVCIDLDAQKIALAPTTRLDRRLVNVHDCDLSYVIYRTHLGSKEMG